MFTSGEFRLAYEVFAGDVCIINENNIENTSNLFRLVSKWSSSDKHSLFFSVRNETHRAVLD